MWLAVERMVWGRREHTGWVRVPLAVFTFAVVCVGWVFFRAKGLATALFVVRQMFSRVAGQQLLSPWQWRMAIFALIVALLEEYGGLLTRLTVAPAWARTIAMIVALLAIELFSATEQTIPFVYFQF
jgi:hypothetical protein